MKQKYAYFFMFVDNHSRNTWVYTLKSKKSILRVFKKFKVSVKCATEKKLKCIHTNAGGEYLRKFEFIVERN
jgi:hypothetical protein